MSLPLHVFIQTSEINTNAYLVVGFWAIPVHHSVGSVTGVITPNSSIQLSSSLTRLRSGTATLWGVDNAYGFAPSCRQMV